MGVANAASNAAAKATAKATAAKETPRTPPPSAAAMAAAGNASAVDLAAAQVFGAITALPSALTAALATASRNASAAHAARRRAANDTAHGTGKAPHREARVMYRTDCSLLDGMAPRRPCPNLVQWAHGSRALYAGPHDGSWSPHALSACVPPDSTWPAGWPLRLPLPAVMTLIGRHTDNA